MADYPGRLTLPLDVRMSRKVALRVRAVNRECWSNAFKGLTAGFDLHYAEGFAVADDIPMAVEHAWLIDPGRAIVDPTPTYHDGAERGGQRTYFAARIFTMPEVVEAAHKYGLQPFSTEGDHTGGLRYPAWRRAFMEAHVWGWGRKPTLELYRQLPGFDVMKPIIEAAEERPGPNEEMTA